VDVSAARNVRRKCSALVDAADSSRRCRAPAASRRSDSPIDERDIAAVAVRALREDGHAGAEYVLTAPQSLSQFEQVSAIGRVIGRSLRIEEISPDDARRELLTIASAAGVNMLLQAWAAAIGQPAHVTSTVARITGARQKTFLESGQPITLQSFGRDREFRIYAKPSFRFWGVSMSGVTTIPAGSRLTLT
jgi:uncharacterized protein YbjT (DUF2867 family)